MFNFKVLGAVLAFGCSPIAVHAQENCGRVESDVARLECYDNWYQSREFGGTTVSENLDAYRKLVETDGNSEVFRVLDTGNACLFQVQYIKSGAPFGLVGRQKVTVDFFSGTVDLANVTRIGREISFLSDIKPSLQLVLKRDATAIHNHRRVEVASSIPLPAFRITLPELLASGRAIVNETIIDRDVRFPIAPVQFRVDSREIYAAFADYQQSCVTD